VGSAAAKAKDFCIHRWIMYSARAVTCYFKMVDVDVGYGNPAEREGKEYFL